MPQATEILALDLLTLTEHTERAGDTLDAALHAQAIERTLAASETITVRRSGRLIAYDMLHPQEDGVWFVTGFNTHPSHRSAPVFQELFEQLYLLAQRCKIGAIRSNVYKTNRLSMAFHRRLGFKVTRENAKGVEFYASLAELGGDRTLQRIATSYAGTIGRGCNSKV